MHPSSLHITSQTHTQLLLSEWPDSIHVYLVSAVSAGANVMKYINCIIALTTF